MTEKWLTFDDLCSELQLRPPQVKKLIKQGKVLGLCHGRKTRLETDWRFVDPGPKLKRAYILLGQIQSREYEIDLAEFPVVSANDFATLCGFSEARVRKLVQRGNLAPFKIGKFSYFTANQVRDFLLRREKKELRAGRARMSTMLVWVRNYLATQDAKTISRADVHADDRLEGELNQLMKLKEPARGKAIAEFWRRFELAKKATL